MQLRRLLWLMSAPGGGRTILFMSFDQPQRRCGSLRPFERALSAGTVIEVVVRPAVAAIRKHTRFVIREGAATARVDSCVVPPASRPAKCPRR